ncbi:MAG TPA: hypothetical protein VMW27_25300 [Thermoanaerobaculia bacterium]|nr:hypothetical protein [Thermoanaerobaculia bacterium]
MGSNNQPRQIAGLAIAGELEDRVQAQPVGVIAVRIAKGDLEDPLPGLLLPGVAHPLGSPLIGQASGKASRQTQSLVQLAQQQSPSIGGDLGCIELYDDGQRRVEGKARRCDTLCHGGRPRFGRFNVLAD